PQTGSRNRRSEIRPRAGPSEAGGSPDQLTRSLIEGGPNPARYRRISSSIPSGPVPAGGPPRARAGPARSAPRGGPGQGAALGAGRLQPPPAGPGPVGDHRSGSLGRRDDLT